jgi:hypothetical protein
MASSFVKVFIATSTLLFQFLYKLNQIDRYPSVLLNGPLSLVEEYWPCKPGLDEDGYPEVKVMIPESIRAAQIRIRIKKINKNRKQKPHLPEQRTRQSGKSCKVRACTEKIPSRYQQISQKKSKTITDQPEKRKKKINAANFQISKKNTLFIYQINLVPKHFEEKSAKEKTKPYPITEQIIQNP